MNRTFTVRQIAYRKKSKFLAVCLDLDLMAEGNTMGEAMDNLGDAICSYLMMCIKDNETDEQIYKKAPKKYFDMFDLFQELEEKKKKNMVESFAGSATYNPSVTNAHFCHA